MDEDDLFSDLVKAFGYAFLLAFLIFVSVVGGFWAWSYLCCSI